VTIRILGQQILVEESELFELWNEFISQNDSSLGILPGPIPRSDLPFICMKVDSESNIVFATTRAIERYNINHKMSFFNLPLPVDCKSYLSDYSTKQIVIVIKCDDLEIYLYPIFHSDKALSKLESFFYLELPNFHREALDPHALFRAVFPALKPPALPQTVHFRDGPTALVSLKIIGIGEWTDRVENETSQMFLGELASGLNNAALESGFVRLHVLGGTALFANDAESQQVQLVFFRVCIQFARQIVEMIERLSEKMEVDVQPSVVFWRGSAVVVHAMDAKGAQADVVGDGCWAGLEIHEKFGVPGIAFACPHKEANRFPNMVRARTWQDSGGRLMDLFLVV
jgi:hypothetical protein